MWRIARKGGTATLIVELFRDVDASDRDAIAAEGLRMLAFSDPGAEARDVRFRPLV
jgi:hypothetical protein